MSLWSDYFEETSGIKTIEEEWGFVSYSFADPFCRIEDLYVVPHLRKGTRGLHLLNRVAEKAKEHGSTHLWTQVWVTNHGADRALRANLACGFKMIDAQNGRIIMTKPIGG